MNEKQWFTWNGKAIGRKATKKPLRRGDRKALQSADNIVEGVTTEPPGSSRVADLMAFYDVAKRFDNPPSPFDV